MYVCDNELGSDLNMADFRDLNHANKTSAKRKRKFQFHANIGDVINNGLRYFGKQKEINYRYYASFVCSDCNELFTANIQHVLDGKTKCCNDCKNRQYIT